MAYSEEGVLIPPHKVKECVEDIPKRNSIKSSKVQEHLRLLGYRINTVNFDFAIFYSFLPYFIPKPHKQKQKNNISSQFHHKYW